MYNKLLFVERVMLASLITLLPAQIGKHFWPTFAYLNGIRIDYLSPTLYLTDLIAASLVVIWLIRKRQEDIRKFLQPNKTIVVGFFLLWIILNTQASSRPILSLYAWLKLGLLAALFCYVKSEVTAVIRYLRRFLPIALTYSSLLAIAQVVKQGSLSGPWYFLGERWFTIATPGIAKAQALSRLLLRPYATFPHPNVLAGFLVVSLIFVFAAKKGGKKDSPTGKWIVLGLSSLAIALSFSQSAWLIAILAIIVQLVRKYRKQAIPWALVSATLGLWLFWAVPMEKESIAQRNIISQAALTIMKDHPTTGVGLGNFIPNLDRLVRGDQVFSSPFLFLQPVHNIFLLAGAETGLLGLCVLAWLFGKAIRAAKRKGMVSAAFALSAILLLGLVDHYWITLQQTRLLLTILLAISISEPPPRSSGWSLSPQTMARPGPTSLSRA